MARATYPSNVDEPISRASNENLHPNKASSGMESRQRRLEEELAEERKKNIFLKSMNVVLERDMEIIIDDFDRTERINEKSMKALKDTIEKERSTATKLNEKLQKIGARLEKQQRDSESKPADMQSQLVDFDKMKATYKAEVVELKAHLKETYDRESESSRTIGQLQNNNRDLKVERDNLQKRLTCSNEAFGKVESGKQTLESKIYFKEVRLNKLETFVEKLMAEIKENNDREAELNIEVQDLQKAAQDNEVARKRLQDTLDASKSVNALLTLNMNDLKKKLQSENNEKEQEVEKLRHIIHDFEMERVDLRNRLNVSEESVLKEKKIHGKLHSKIHSEKLHVKELETEIEKIYIQVKEKNDKESKLKKEIHDLQKSNRDIEVARKQLQDSLNASNGVSAMYKLNMDSVTKRLQSKEQRLKHCEVSMKQLLVPLEEKNATELALNNLIEDLKKINNDIEIAREKLEASLQKSNADYEAKLATVEERLQSKIDTEDLMQKEVEKCKAEAKGLRDQLKEKSAREDELSLQINLQKQINHDFEIERDGLRNKVKSLEDTVLNSKGRMEAMKKNLQLKSDDYEADARELRRRIEEMKTENGNLNERILRQKHTIDNLEIERDNLRNTVPSLEESTEISRGVMKTTTDSREKEIQCNAYLGKLIALLKEKEAEKIESETEVALLKNLNRVLKDKEERLSRTLASSEKLKESYKAMLTREMQTRLSTKALSPHQCDSSSVTNDANIGGNTASPIDLPTSQASNASESEHYNIITHKTRGDKTEQRTEDSTLPFGLFGKIGYKFWKKFGSEWYEGEVKSNYFVIHSVYEDGDHDIIKEEEFKELFEKGKIS
ncbi:hypothetical protein ACHAXS_011331, partial [Conticribra weissflogii]